MSRLLVSVRDVDEARLALAGGAAVVDVKEPRRGSLGRPDVLSLGAIVQALGGRVPLSAALGELADDPPDAQTLAALAGYDYAKIGLAGALHLPHWMSRWREVMEQLPPGTRPVAVIYADWRRCDAPPPDAILQAATSLGCPAVLVDTHAKNAGNLLSYLSDDPLQRLAFDVRARGMRLVLAGGVGAAEFASLVQASPWLIAVRGAACEGGREGSLSQTRVAELARHLRACARHSHSSSTMGSRSSST